MSYEGLRLLLGVSSSIAAFRALDIASSVIKGGGEVRAVMTPNATKLVGPAAFDAITTNRTVTSLWNSDSSGDMDHLAATKWANVFCVAPATASTLGRLALGFADDALSTFAIAWPDPLVIAPAMNPTMYQHPTVQEHVAALRARGHTLVGPGSGRTACGDLGIGRLADVEDILIAIVDRFRAASDRPDLTGKTVLITSGPTREFADPVRCVTNPSTGRMGVALARQALRAGARVILVTGPSEIPVPVGLHAVERVTTAEQMRDAVLKHLDAADAAIFSAAVSDWKPAETAAQKAKKEDGPEEMTLRLVRTPDVALAAAEKRRPGQVFVGFAAESDNVEQNARAKMHRKAFDLIVANPITEPGAGFGTETNRATLITAEAGRAVPMTSKDELATLILRELQGLLDRQ